MTTENFIKRIEAYYGVRYRPSQIPYIEQYLKQREGRPLDHLFGLVIKTFSSQYGKAPDIAIFDGLRSEVISSIEQERDCLALPPASEVPSEEEREQIRKGLEKFNKRYGLAIPVDAWNGQK